jgi:hypothetical protein
MLGMGGTSFVRFGNEMSNATARKFDVASGRKSPASYQLQKLKSVHNRIRDLVFLGESNKAIADKLGVSTQMVAYTRASPLVRKQLGIMEGAASANALEVAHHIQELAPFALATLETIMLNPGSDAKIRRGIAEGLLDRAGHSAVKQVAVAHAPMSNSQAIKEIKERAINSGIIAEAKIVGTLPIEKDATTDTD